MSADPPVYDWYISGPMRGYPRYNFDAFHECERHLRYQYPSTVPEIFNPARDDEERGFDPSESIVITDDMMYEWMRRDLEAVTQSRNIILLPGFEHSQGARREIQVARWCGLIPWLYLPDNPATRRIASTSWSWINEKIDQRHEGDIKTSEEIRVTSATGGQKGTKPARYDLIPAGPLDKLARLYGKGAEKYDDHNWRKGYNWSLSYAAMMRHAWAFWSGEDNDPEHGLPHLASVAFHAFALMEFMETHPEFDNRIKDNP